jgi:hypothetical protein
MDVGFAVGTCRGLDSEADVGSGVQLSDVIEARGLDDVFERAAGVDGSSHRAAADGQARDAVWRGGREVQRGGGADVRTDNVGRAQIPLFDQARQVGAHRIRCDQLRAPVRVAEARKVDRDHARHSGHAVPDPPEGPEALRPRAQHQYGL